MEEVAMSHVSASNDDRKLLTDDDTHIAPATEAANGKEPMRHVRVAILGTGFSGLGMAIRLKQQGQSDFTVLEKAANIGGTWRDNTYPGCACDVPSHLYSFSFALNPNWTRTYSSQREIWDYLRYCANKFNILPHIQWNTELQRADWNEDEQCWHITTSQGQLCADILILGNGPLSEPSLPAIKGIENFKGTLFHSATWRHDYDLTGKRVGVIGTGASTIQFVPRIQPQVAHLSLFQRTPPWILPRLDKAIAPWKRIMYRMLPFTQRAIRALFYAQRELTAYAFVYKPDRLKEAMKLAQEHLERQVADPVLRAKLTPSYTLGCKRVLLSDDFYPALTLPNVDVVTNHIREIGEHSIITDDGVEHEIDTLICATGFHVTNAQLPQYIFGRDGQSLADKWHEGSRAYLGTAVTDFPNMFLLIGPNTGLGHTSMVFMIESQIAYILDCLRTMDKGDLQTIEIQPQQEDSFNTEMQRRMKGTVWASGCASWYLDANGRNTTIWPGFTIEFRRRTRRFDVQHYNMLHREATSHTEKAVV